MGEDHDHIIDTLVVLAMAHEQEIVNCVSTPEPNENFRSLISSISQTSTVVTEGII